MKTVAFSELRDVAFEIRASQERSQEYRRCRVALECEMKAQRSETPMHQPNRLQTAEPLRNPNPKPALEPFQKPKCHNSEGMSLKHHITADLGFLQPATSCPATRRSWQHCKRRPFTQHLCPSLVSKPYTPYTESELVLAHRAFSPGFRASGSAATCGQQKDCQSLYLYIPQVPCYRPAVSRVARRPKPPT